MTARAEIPVGKKFGELTVLGRSPNRPGAGGTHVFVRCDCGTETSMTLRSLHNGTSRCNRASHWDASVLARSESLVGQQFGLLTVISATAERSTSRKSQVRVRCECGVERFAIINHLLRGNIASCGGEAHQTIRPQVRRWKWTGTAHTYVIEAKGTGLVKIGSARDVNERLVDLQYPCPVELTVIAVLDSNIERELHAELASDRVHGEWFKQTDAVMTAIERSLVPCSLSIFGEMGVGSRGRTRGSRHTCARCGDLGHHAKTCGRPLSSAA